MLSNHALIIVLLITLTLATAAQTLGDAVWIDPGTSTFFGEATGHYTLTPPLCGRPPGCSADDDDNMFIPGYFGRDYGNISYAECKALMFTCPVYGRGFARASAEGLGSSMFIARWKIVSEAYHNCECGGYEADGSASADIKFDIAIQTDPPGQTVTVYYEWWANVNNDYDPEDDTIPDDPSRIENVSLTVGGINLIAPGSINFIDSAALLILPPPSQPPGSIVAQDGDLITITITGDTFTKIETPPQEQDWNQDQSQAEYIGWLTLSINTPAPPFPVHTPTTSVSLFSVDIGSDTEMSDPNLDGDEVFDPGDLYYWYGAPLPAGGADGFFDDPDIFWTDFWPEAPDGPPATTGADTCAGLSSAEIATILGDRFDLDGTDVIDASLITMIPDLALDDPIAPFPSDCIHDAEFLVISHDDDWSGHYAGTLCEVPVERTSPMGHTYGSTAGHDEVLAVNVSYLWPPSVTGPPAVIGPSWPIHSEVALHSSLGPNPDADEADDDDVDALDVSTVDCGIWYFSADHEARGVDPFNGDWLDPGAIYQVLGPPSYGPTKVIDPVIHLGLPPGVDIDAFEFAWIQYCPDPMDPASCTRVLGMVFSVDDDDYLTIGVDESGGLHPALVYASFFDGTHFALVDRPLSEDIDALATTAVPFGPSGCQVVGGPDCNNNGLEDFCEVWSGLADDVNGNWIPDECETCLGDMNCDGQVDFADINPFVLYLSSPASWQSTYSGCLIANGDIDSDGVYPSFTDINPFVKLLTSAPLPIPCP